MNKRVLIGFVSFVSFVPSFAFAASNAVFAIYHIAEKKVDVIEKKNEVGIMHKEEVKTLRADIAGKREMLKTEIKEKQDAFKTNVQQKREAIKMETKTLSPDALKEKRTMLRDDIKKERTELHEQIKEKREIFKDEAKERIDTLKKKVSEERAKIIEVFFGKMVRKFEAAINRLRTLADRIDGRLDKFEDAGKDVLQLKSSLDKARMVTDEAESALDRAKEEFNALATSNNPQEYFKKVKEIVAGVMQKIKDAHKALVDVINSIKGSSNVLE